MHAMIVGANGTGKSTLIRHVLQALSVPIFGFETVKEDSLEEPDLGSPIYIYEAGKEHIQTSKNLVGYCHKQKSSAIPTGFDHFAPLLLCPPPDRHLIMMDEIGFMESKSELFCQAILSVLDGDIPVIAAVRDKNVPFLETVRSHPKAHVFRITQENRLSLYDELLDFMKTQLEEYR